MNPTTPYPGQAILAERGQIGQQSAIPLSPLEQGLQRTSVELDNLHNELCNLYARLTPYLADIPPSKPENVLSENLGNSPAISRIAELNTRIALMANELSGIKARLEA